MSRTFAITYGSYVIGASGTDANVRLTGKHRTDENYATFTVSFEVLVLGASISAFNASEAALVAAFRKPDQALSIVVDSNSRRSYSHSSNTGFNARPEIEKVGGTADTDRSARYRVAVTVQLPADLSGRDGRQSSAVDVRTEANGSRIVTISGVYTALSSNSARDQYASAIASYVAAVKSDLSITNWELVGKPSESADDQDKTLQFSRVYREIIRNQSVGTADNASLVNPRLFIRRVLPAANDTRVLGAVEPLRTYEVNYIATVDWTQTTDLDTLYTSTIRPHILGELRTLAGGALYVVREGIRFDLDSNRVFSDWEVLTDSGYDLLSATHVVEDIRDFGEVRYPVWNGNPYSRDVYQGPKTHIKRVRRSVYRVAGSGGDIDVPTPSGFRPNNDVHKTESRAIGNFGGDQIDTELLVASQEFERVDPAFGIGSTGVGL